MTDQERPPPAVIRNRMVNAFTKRGKRKLPTALRAAPEVVLWRAKPCNCRMLAVYLDRNGWHIVGERFRVPMDAWIERQRRRGLTEIAVDERGTVVDFNLDNYRAGMFGAFMPRQVEGFIGVQPLDFEAWDLKTATGFEVGCDHEHGMRPMTDILEDCRRFRECRVRVERMIRW